MTPPPVSHALSGGFATPPTQSARAFRAVMEAMSRPGLIVDLAGAQPPAPISVAAGTAVLTLVDRTTPIWLAPDLDGPVVRAWITFHTGAPFVGPHEAAFVVGGWAQLLPLSQFAVGTAEYPDRSATVIVDAPRFDGVAAHLAGPGIADKTPVRLPDPAQLAGREAGFPLGVDMIFTAGAQAFALPRSTKVEVDGCM